MVEVNTSSQGTEGCLPLRSDYLQVLCRFDWTAAGLSPPDHWDPSLKTVLRLISQASIPMSLMLGPQGILVPNVAMQRLFSEFSEHEILGRSIFELLPHTSDFYSQVLTRVFAGEACNFSDQQVQFHRLGLHTNAWFNFDFVPVTNADGAVVSVLVIVSDVTRSVDPLHRVAESEQNLRLSLESSGIGIWNLDVQANLSTVDPSAARLFGLSAADSVYRIDNNQITKAIHPEDRSRVTETLKSAIGNRANYRCRYRVVSEEGDLRWVITSGRPTFDESGNFVRLLGVVVDVTDQMETASALAESRFQFETLTETLPQIVWSCKADGSHDYFSARWSEFTGISLDDVTEDTWKQLVYPEHWGMVCSVWDEARRDGKPYDLDYRFRHHTGEFRWLRVMALPIRDDAGEIIRWFGTSTDVHDAYLMSEERENFARELERIAIEDALTEVLTRRAFIERGTRAINQAAEFQTPVSLLMMDVDHFKSINDSFGHPCGDTVLSIVAQRIKASISREDLVGRLGGEEFAVLLWCCTPEQAQGVAERIRTSVEAEPISLDSGQKISVTISIGVTSRVQTGDNLSQMLLIADKALYKAKTGGRNRSVFFASL